MRCAYGYEGCAEEVNPDDTGVWREVTGKVQNRKGGGAHGIHDQEDTGRYYCPNCMALKRRGIPLGQRSLL